jgi:hypothetical protein
MCPKALHRLCGRGPSVLLDPARPTQKSGKQHEQTVYGMTSLPPPSTSGGVPKRYWACSGGTGTSRTRAIMYVMLPLTRTARRSEWAVCPRWGPIGLLGALALMACRDIHGPPILAGPCLAALMLRRRPDNRSENQREFAR